MSAFAPTTTPRARTLFVLVLLALAVLAAAGSAAAGTLTASGGKVFYVADPGETDVLQIEDSPTSVTIHAGVTLDSGGGCVINAGTNTGVCSLDATEIRLDLKDGNDEVSTLVSGIHGDVPLFVTAGTGDDTVVGGRGADRLFGNKGDDTLTGSFGNDTLEGDRGDDTLDGQAGNDFLEGDEGFSAGNDVLTGGPGLDTFEGGPGNDLLLAVDGVVNETVSCGTGFDAARIDRIFDSLGQLVAKDAASGCES